MDMIDPVFRKQDGFLLPSARMAHSYAWPFDVLKSAMMMSAEVWASATKQYERSRLSSMHNDVCIHVSA
eukprot:scaffold386188_cov34-Prasinocladus_malaysianus.AAC.1